MPQCQGEVSVPLWPTVLVVLDVSNDLSVRHLHKPDAHELTACA